MRRSGRDGKSLIGPANMVESLFRNCTSAHSLTPGSAPIGLVATHSELPLDTVCRLSADSDRSLDAFHLPANDSELALDLRAFSQCRTAFPKRRTPKMIVK